MTAEQVPGLTRRFGRRTERLRSTLVSVGLALAGRAGARMTDAHPDDLPEGHRLQLKAVPANCPEPTALAEHVRSFGHMVARPQGDQLRTWIEAAASTTELPGLRSFARHLERDLDSVTAGFTLPWNSGVVEGHVDRIKMLKRQMLGRRPRRIRTPAQTSPVGVTESHATTRSGPEPDFGSHPSASRW